MKELITEIRKKIKLRENGPAMDTMRKLGINYKTIHGLSISEINDIAKPYVYNHELAFKLWKYDNREFKILATLIEDPENVSPKQLVNWANEVSDSELAEQLTFNLALNTPHPKLICSLWLSQKNPYAHKSGTLLLAWMARKLPQIPDLYFSQKLEILPKYIDSYLYIAKGISLAIRAIGKRNLFLNKKALELIESLKEYQDYNTRFIVEECQWELESDIVQEKLK